MSKTLEQRLAEVDKRYGLPTEDYDAVIEYYEDSEEQEVILREGVTARYDPESGAAVIRLDDLAERGASLKERLDAVDIRHGVRLG